MKKKKHRTAEVKSSRRPAGQRTEVRLSGFGGQGIILAGNILGRAVVLYEGQHAVFTQSYGPEARGGACSADVVVSDGPIHYPKVSCPDVVVFMSEEAKNTYGAQIAPETIVLYDEDLVRIGELGERASGTHAVPATRLAESLGRKMVANIVMLGFLAAMTDLVGVESLKKAVLDSVPKGSEDLNASAFERGYQHGREKRGG